MSQLSFSTFVTDLIFYPEHAVAEDQTKARNLSIALGILTLGIFPLVVSIGWGASMAFSYIKEKLSSTQNKAYEVSKPILVNKQDNFKPAQDQKAPEPIIVTPPQPNDSPKPAQDQKAPEPIIETAPQPIDNPKPAQDQKTAPKPIVYQKGNKEVPKRNKEKSLGKGCSDDAVYEQKGNAKLAIKLISDVNEYEVGGMLDHPAIAKSLQLYIRDDGVNEKKNKLVMEKVEGKNITTYIMGPEINESRKTTFSPIPKQEAIKLMEQAKECCLYLFRAGACWRDVNAGNIFIENETGNLKLIDFGFWSRVDNPQERAFGLLMGALELNGWIMESSSTYTCVSSRFNHAAFCPTLFPESIFDAGIRLTGIRSLGEPYKYHPWWNNFKNKVFKLDEKQLEIFISNYYDEVLKKFKEIDLQRTVG